MISQADFTKAQLDSLGTPTGNTPVTFGTAQNGIVYQGNEYSEKVNLGGTAITDKETIFVATSAKQYMNGQQVQGFTLANAPQVLGIGVNAPGGVIQPISGTGMSVTAFLPGALKTGELINVPAGQLVFGPNPLPPGPTITGDPVATLVAIVDLPNSAPGFGSYLAGSYIDTGGMYGSVPPNDIDVASVPIGTGLPVDTLITVNSPSGVVLYTETITNQNHAPVVGPPNSNFNTGEYPFLIDPIYILNGGVGETIFDGSGPVATIPEPGYPFYVAVSPVGPEAGDIYATNLQGTLSVMDPTTNQVVDTITPPGGSSSEPPFDLAVSPTTGDIYAGSHGADVNTPGTLWVISPTTNSVTATIPVNNPDVVGVAVNNTGSDVYVLTNAINGGDQYGNSPTDATVEVIDPTTNQVINTIALPGINPDYMAISDAGPEEGDLYISSADITGATQFTSGTLTDTVTVLNPTTGSMDTITLPHLDDPGAIAVSDSGPTAGTVYLDIGNATTGTVTGQVDVINPATNAITATIPLASDVSAACSGPCDIAVSNIGAYAGDVFVTGQVASGEGTVFVINPTTDTVIDTFPVSSGSDTTLADGLAISDTGPEAGDIYTANTLVESGDSLEPTTVSEINPTTEGVPG